jgi:hypothetical protein
MNKLIFSLIVLAYIVNTSYAVYFKVLCAAQDYGGTGVSVNIDGTSHPMVSANSDILYEFTYDGVPNQYYYEITGTTINELTLFNNTPRTWDSQSTTTLYEIFGRPITIGDDIIATIPRIREPLPGYDKYSLLFQEGEMPVISVHISNADYLQLTTMVKKQKIEYKMEFDLFTPYEKYHFTNATLSFSGQGSVNQEKKPYKFDLSGNEEDKANSEIFNRKEFKLRSLRFDESYMKNKLIMDMAESLALPLTQTAACRLYVNNKSFGLYELSDMYKKKFVRRFFNPPKISEEYVYGSLYKGVSQQNNAGNPIPAYLYPDFEDVTISDLYESVVAADPTNAHADIQKFITWLNALPETASKEEIEQKFDVDMFLKYIILEYLSCHWDGYLGNGNNYFVYVEPNDGKYHFFSYDFDITLGKWCKAITGDIDTYVTEVVSVEDRFYGSQKQRKPVLYTKIIKNPNITPLFNDLVKEIVGNLFNIDALGPRLDYFYEFYKYDMYWDNDCLRNLPTHEFVKSQEIPEKTKIDAQYSDTSNDVEDLRSFIKSRSSNAAQLYGVTSFSAKGKFGEVGGKLMNIGKYT